MAGSKQEGAPSDDEKEVTYDAHVRVRGGRCHWAVVIGPLSQPSETGKREP